MKKAALLAPMASVHERFNRVNIEVLRNMGCEVHLIGNFSLRSSDRKWKEKMECQGIKIHQIAFARASLRKNLKIVPGLKKLLQDEAFDLLHVHTETGGILARLSAGKKKSTRMVYTPHGMSFYKGSSLKSQILYRPAEWWICRGMDANLGLNREETELLKRWNPDTAHFIHGIGLNIEDIIGTEVERNVKKQELSISAHMRVILSVGELNQNKNHKVVIKALAKNREQDLCYVICGEGDKKGELLELASELGIRERLILAGYRCDIKEILKAADVFVFPSFHEGLAVSMMEAMAAGLPVVCSRIRGNVDLIEEGKGGYLFAPSDDEALGRALDKILEDRSLAKKMGAHNKKVVQNYSYQKVYEETERIYRKVLGTV